MGVTLRPFDVQADYEPIAELIARTEAHDAAGRAMTAEDLQIEVAPGRWWEPDRDVQVAEVDGVPVGFIRVSSRVRADVKVVHRQDIWVAPEWRRHGVGRALEAWAVERSLRLRDAGSIGDPGMLHEMAGAPDDTNVASNAFAIALGYRPIRYSFEMRRDLHEPLPDAPLPAGLELRPVREADHRRIWEANVEAFEDHWEHATPTESDFVNTFADPVLDTSLWVIAWDGDEVAGITFNMIYAEENAKLGVQAGWLDDVSVRRPWRRRGLGAALIAESLRRLLDRGMDEALLGVDAENPTGALALYEKLGFRRLRSYRIYRKPL